MNVPVVCDPEEALDCFLRTEMDVLALGDFSWKEKISYQLIVIGY